MIGCVGVPFPGGDRDRRRVTVLSMTLLFTSNNDRETPDDTGAFDR